MVRQMGCRYVNSLSAGSGVSLSLLSVSDVPSGDFTGVYRGLTPIITGLYDEAMERLLKNGLPAVSLSIFVFDPYVTVHAWDIWGVPRLSWCVL